MSLSNTQHYRDKLNSVGNHSPGLSFADIGATGNVGGETEKQRCVLFRLGLMSLSSPLKGFWFPAAPGLTEDLKV